MLIRTPTDLGAVIRGRRRRQALDQQALAKKIGTSRQWVVEVEKGRPGAEVGLVLRVLDSLGVALSADREIGRVQRDKRGRLSFVYAADWRDAPEAHPLSLSMPIAAAEHGHAVIEAFLWGLLPDNESILDGWARKFHVSARNPFALISHVGEDCAGAVQFVRPERLADRLAARATQCLETLEGAA